jgi:alanyl-tRNA synthetase
MTEERLYYTDPHLIEFDAVVRGVVRRDDHCEVTLDRTAFYPASGGQPFDTGTLGNANVINVAESEDGGVTHYVDRELEKDARVRGRIDWSRRFDHMQQHSGQHLLSAAFVREAGARTIGFHLGSACSTIDLDRELTPAQIAGVEATANGILWEDRDVSVRFVTPAEAAALPLRKDPVRTGDLRIVEIADYDLSACGGTHVTRTGSIGLIAIANVERFKGGQRVEFLCGGRALRAYRRARETVSAGVRLLSVLPEELPAAIEKLQAAARAHDKVQDSLQERLAAHEAAALAAHGERVGSLSLVARAVAGWSAVGLKQLAAGVASKPGMLAVLVSTDSPSLVVVARSQDVSMDAGDLLKKLLERFGGKGGGRGALAQGGGLLAPADEVLAAVPGLLPPA